MGKQVSSASKKKAVVKVSHGVSSSSSSTTPIRTAGTSPKVTPQSNRRGEPVVDFGASTYGKRMQFHPPTKPKKSMPTVEESAADATSESGSDSQSKSTLGEVQPQSSVAIAASPTVPPPIASTPAPTLSQTIANAEVLLAAVEKQAASQRLTIAAKSLLEVLRVAVALVSTAPAPAPPTASTEESSVVVQPPPGWTMFEFLTSEGVKHVKQLNKTKFATPEDRSDTLFFEDPKANSRIVCIACFKGGYRPASCVFINKIGFLGHRKRGAGANGDSVSDPCLEPAVVTGYKEVRMKNGGTTNQPIVEVSCSYKSYARFSIPLDHSKDEYCNIFFEPERVHAQGLVKKYKEQRANMLDIKRANKRLPASEREKVPNVQKPLSSKWRMVELHPTIQNIAGFNIHAHVEKCISDHILSYSTVDESGAKDTDNVDTSDSESD